MLIRRASPLAVASALLVIAACGTNDDAETTLPIRKATSPIVNGTKDSGTAHNNVVLLYQSEGAMCTGSLIAPKVVLTARHCVSKMKVEYVTCPYGHEAGADYAPSSISVYTGVDPTSSPPPIAPTGVKIFHPDTDSLCYYDIALIVTNIPITGITPLPVRVLSPPKQGEKFMAIGYGLTNPNNYYSSGVRYYKNNVQISSLYAAEFVGSQSICQGDSGGPAITSAGAVFGVTSRGADCYGNDNWWTRTDKFRALIDEAVTYAGQTYTDENGTVLPDGSVVGTGGSTGQGGSTGTGGASGKGGSAGKGGSGGTAGKGGAAGKGGSAGSAPKPGQPGEWCDSPDACADGNTCVADLNQQYCAPTCSEEDPSCPDRWECATDVGACFQTKACESSDDCSYDWLCWGDSAGNYCTPPCSEDNPDCPGGYTCDTSSGACYKSPQTWTDTGTKSGGCSVPSGAPSRDGLFAFAALGLATLLASRRRSR